MTAVYSEVKSPIADGTNKPIMISDETIKQRYENVLLKMHDKNYDVLLIYADLEHGSNFEYLSGFLPRFEEALLVVHKNRENYMIMGNENMNKVSHARIAAKAIHAPQFSLPNQPMYSSTPMYELLGEAKLEKGQRIGIVGWKSFTSHIEDNNKTFDIPYYIVQALTQLVGDLTKVYNASDIFIGNNGVRRINNINEIEHYEFGAALASDCMLDAMNRLTVGISEMNIGDILNSNGQKNNVVTIAAFGKRFEKANLYPTDRKLTYGDPVSLTVGYKGGLSSRAGFAVECEDQLPKEQYSYLEKVVKPYYGAIIKWLEDVHCGQMGFEVYNMINAVLPKKKYGWTLCPGHLTADEEWMSSPIYEGSKEILLSSMLFQIDIIPSIEGFNGTSAECTVLLADEYLRNMIKKKSPDLWNRIENRRKYIKNELMININNDVLPMGSTVGYLRPYLLKLNMAMKNGKL